MKTKSWGLLVLILLCCGCYSRPQLFVTEYALNHKMLASRYVDAPDERKYQEFYGQKLIIDWDIPKENLEGHKAYLDISLRFQKGKKVDFRYPVDTQKGRYTYLIDYDIVEKDGMLLTYFVGLYQDETLLSSWRHHTWTPYIEIMEEPLPQDNEESDNDEVDYGF